jgi:uncharacterized protein (DUF1684 family)
MQQIRIISQKKNSSKKTWLGMAGLIFLIVFTFAGQTEMKQKDSLSVSSWKKSIIKTRRQKDKEFKHAPTSPMAGVKRLIIKAGQKTFLIAQDGAITLSNQKNGEAKFVLTKEEGKWSWDALAAGVVCRAGDKELKPGEQLPGRVTFKVDRFTLPVYPAGEDLTLLIFDPERREVKEFSRLLYFPPDREYAVQAKIERFPEMKKVTVLTSRNLEKTFYRYAKIHFSIQGKELTLTAFKFSLLGANSRILFFPFMDKTSDIETYGGGRFLEIHEPLADTFILDFNLCFNPLCNYSAVYNCAVPPRENFLDVPVKAGEKTYPH